MHQHGPWLIEHRTRKYTSEFVEVLEDRVVRPDGAPGSYATVTLKPGVAVLPVDRDGLVHLTEQFRYAIGRDSIEVPSGTLEPNEDPLDGGRREIREELGIVAKQWNDCGAIDLDTSIVRCPVRLFSATDLQFTRASPDGTEKIRARTLPLIEAVALVMNGTITHPPSCVLILKAFVRRR
jgi:8-oxo-dGTP pyrophosphatase MutT (NUDIX family)